MTSDYLRHNNVINNLINNFNNHNVINHPIDQIVTLNPSGIPVVDGYVFNGWDTDFKLVRGQLTNESLYNSGEEEVVSVGVPIVVGRPIFPPWALEVCVMIGKKI